MADIHPEVQGLLDSLLVSGLPDLGRLATERVLHGEHPERDDREGVSAGVPPDPRRQLSLADTAVTDVLLLEIELTQRTREVLEEFRALQTFRREEVRSDTRPPPTVLESVVILSPGSEEGERTAERQDKPLSDERRVRLERLLEAWRRGVDDARRRLETWS